MASSDDEFLSSARSGDRAALEELLKRHGPEVRRSLHGQIPRRWQSLLSADDVLQQTYTDAFLDIRRFAPTGDGSFPAWLRTLATNNLRDALRALKSEKRGGEHRRFHAPEGQDSFEALYEHLVGATTQTTPSQKAMRDEAMEILRRALQRLPNAYRRVVEMHDLQGRPMPEIAGALGRSVGAAYLLRIRAHRRLRELLSGQSTVFRDLP